MVISLKMAEEEDMRVPGPLSRAKSDLSVEGVRKSRRSLANSLEGESIVTSPSTSVNASVDLAKDGYLEVIGNIAKQLVGWEADAELKFREYSGGITNRRPPLKEFDKELGWAEDSLTVLCRIFGEKTEEIIDREAELVVMKVLYSRGLAPRLYGTFSNGMVYGHFPGTPLEHTDLGEDRSINMIAERLAVFHSIKSVHLTPESSIWTTAENFIDMIDDQWSHKHGNVVIDLDWIAEKKELLRSKLSKLQSPLVLCHNDLLAGNIIYDKSIETVRFIDYEYASFNPRGFDLGNHFNEYAGPDLDWDRFPTREIQARFARAYLHARKLEDSDDAVAQLVGEAMAYSLASNLYWGLWAIVQSQVSKIEFDFASYGANRLSRFCDNLTNPDFIKQ